jgi:hypothetical protein
MVRGGVLGQTDDGDANRRIGQLYATGVPLPFDIQFACRVKNPLEVQWALDEAFAPCRLDPRPEFFRIDPAQAVAILRLLHEDDATDEIARQPNDVDPESLAAVELVRKRRPNLDLFEMAIDAGSLLEWAHSLGVQVTVVGPRKVKLEEDELPLSAATQRLIGSQYPVRPAPHWKFRGRLLSELYDETYSEFS